MSPPPSFSSAYGTSGVSGSRSASSTGHNRSAGSLSGGEGRLRHTTSSRSGGTASADSLSGSLVRGVERAGPRRSLKLKLLNIRYALASLFGRVSLPEQSGPPARRELGFGADSAGPWVDVLLAKLGARRPNADNLLAALHDTVGEGSSQEQFDELFSAALDEKVEKMDTTKLYHLHKRLQGLLRNYPDALTELAQESVMSAASSRSPRSLGDEVRGIDFPPGRLSAMAQRLEEINYVVADELNERGFEVSDELLVGNRHTGGHDEFEGATHSGSLIRGNDGAKPVTRARVEVERFAKSAQARVAKGEARLSEEDRRNLGENLTAVAGNKEGGDLTRWGVSRRFYEGFNSEANALKEMQAGLSPRFYDDSGRLTITLDGPKGRPISENYRTVLERQMELGKPVDHVKARENATYELFLFCGQNEEKAQRLSRVLNGAALAGADELFTTAGHNGEAALQLPEGYEGAKVTGAASTYFAVRNNDEQGGFDIIVTRTLRPDTADCGAHGMKPLDPKKSALTYRFDVHLADNGACTVTDDDMNYRIHT